MVSRTRLAVLGSPIAHSRSPRLHRTCYGLLGRADLNYSALDVSAEGFAPFWAALDDSWLGLSLTMPLKETAVVYLAGVDAYGVRTGAVNTVLFTDEGPLGFNTDVVGFLEVLRAQAVRPESAHDVLVLGAGATAASALCALSDMGVSGVRVAARRSEAVDGLARRFPELRVEWQPLPATGGSGDLGASASAPARLVINTLPAAAFTPALAHAVVHDLADGNGLLVDALYDPSPPPLLAAWRAAGGRGVDGLELLREQGLAQVLLFTGSVVDADLLRRLRAAADAAIR